MKPCITCKNKPIKNGIYKAELQNFELKRLPKNNKEYHSIENTEEIRINGLLPNSIIFYFATSNRDFTKSIQIREKAYGKLENSGITKVNNKGESILHLKCPQLYMNDDNKVYSRHFHFLYWDVKKNNWNQNLYTHQILCNVNKNFVIKNIKKIILINALPSKYFNEKHIESSISLPYNKRYTEDYVIEKIKEIHPSYNGDKLIPIILYCKKNCNNAEKLYNKLNKLGFYNTMHYYEGISEW